MSCYLCVRYAFGVRVVSWHSCLAGAMAEYRNRKHNKLDWFITDYENLRAMGVDPLAA